MPIRPAIYSDLLPSSKILARAFKDEYLWTTYMHPKLDQYPDDMYLLFLNKLRVGWASGPNNYFNVSYKTDSNGQEIITGIAYWQRMSPKASPSLLTHAKRSAMNAYIWLESFVYPNRAVDPSRTTILAETAPFVGHHWSGTRSDLWNLDLLGVDPDYEGQGFGREQVSWGFEQARKEGVGCSVVSSEGKEGFYQNVGFDVIAGTVRDFGGDANPIKREGIGGGTILFWDNGVVPTGIKQYGEA